MLRHYTALIVVAVICIQSMPAAYARAAAQQKSQGIDTIKAKVSTIGLGRKVSVTMYNGDRVNGSISQITNDGFVVTDKMSGRDVGLKYSEAKAVKGAHSKIFWVAIGVGALIAIGLVRLAACASHGDGCS